MKECLVEFTIDANPKWVTWLFQTDDDSRFEVREREGATVFVNADAAIAAAETYLVESAAEAVRSGKRISELTYRVLRW
jgi:hypothetical protein